MTVRKHLKAIERGGRRLAIRAIGGLLGRPEPGAPSPWGTRPCRVLFLRHDRIGDMIVSTGVIRAIAGAHPGIAVDVLASPVNAPVLAEQDGVARVVVLDRSRPWTFVDVMLRLRRARYDAVIDCMVTAPSLTTLLLMLASGAKHRIGVARRGNELAYTIPVPPRDDARHMVDQLATLLAAFGLDPGSLDVAPHVALSDDERALAERTWRTIEDDGRAPRLLMNVSSGKAARRWPDERFVAVLRRVRADAPHVGVLVVGAPHESGRAARIAADGGGVYTSTSSIREALALVDAADLVFTPDTSIAHAASAFRRPAVVLFLDGKPPLWGLYGVDGANLASPDQTLASLPLSPVLDAVCALLDRHAVPPPQRAAS